jgi:hypothetical protein
MDTRGCDVDGAFYPFEPRARKHSAVPVSVELGGAGLAKPVQSQGFHEPALIA